MLKLKGIVKEYPTGDSKVVALKGVDIEFRKNEFVSILGHSGCGKTTLLNIIGGLDQYTSGDLIIEGRSTKDFKNSDWDAYRNHSVGFVFQNYNLIPHQTVLANVELALTLSGVSKTERRKRAAEALEKVGLGDQLNKKPNQMSGGQMQRVAIARALVNNPEILLADEPTGALDTETSIQIMDLLKEISKEKLVIMVTHNPELADEYSTRIIRLIDGKIVNDSDPYSTEDVQRAKTKAEKKSESKASKKKPTMSIFTALSLSLNNLMTKKARTFLTSFAGSIGIIGIALILALSNGFQVYIDSIQKETLSSYPIMLESVAMDMNAMLNNMAGTTPGVVDHDLDKVYSNTMASAMMDSFTAETQPNDLESFKAYLKNPKSSIEENTSSIQYTYGGKMNIFSSDVSKGVNQVYPSPVISMMESMMGNIDLGGMQIDTSAMSSMTKTMNSWQELIDNQDLLKEQYELIAGEWPSKYNEVVLIVDKNNEISDIAIQGLGLKTREELMQSFTAMSAGEEYTPEMLEIEYEDILNLSFKVVLEPEFFQYNSETKTWDDMRGDEAYVNNLIKNGEEIKVVGIMRPSDDALMVATTGAVGYSSALTEHIISKTNECEIVKQQKANPDVDIFTGIPFVKEETVTPEATPETVAPAVSDVSLDPQINTPALAEGMSPDASSMKFDGNSPSASFTANSGGMMDFSSFPEVTEEEVYAMIAENFTGEEKEKMDRVVELLLKNMLSISERNELAGYLDELLAGQEIEGMGQISGSQAVTFLTMMSKSDKLKMLGGIMSGEMGEMAPPVEGGTPDTPAEGEGTTENPGEVTPEPEPEPEPEPLAKSYEEALAILGVADINNPKSIYIYPLDFEAKDAVSAEIEKYNQAVAVTTWSKENRLKVIGSIAKNELATVTTQKISGNITDFSKYPAVTEEEIYAAIDANFEGEEAKELKRTAELLAKDNLTKAERNELIANLSVLFTENEIAKTTALSDNEEKGQIKYTDYMGILLSSVSSIINIVSWVLSAFVSISLIVSSIMIGIITYISVLERTKEIGILRAIGASKKDISRVFNAETLIVGFISGAMGILITVLLSFIINTLIIPNVTSLPLSAQLPVTGALILVAISIVLTVISGLFPAKIASRKDPVEALRSE